MLPDRRSKFNNPATFSVRTPNSRDLRLIHKLLPRLRGFCHECDIFK
jgi:hypothetical protein